MGAPVAIRRGAVPAGLDPERIALAAFALADAEKQAELAGREIEIAETFLIGERFGRAEAAFAYRLRGLMHLGHANELQALQAGAAQ